MKFSRFGITGRVLVLITAVLGLGIAALLAYTEHATRSHAVRFSVQSAEAVIGQFKTIRAYYTDQVVKKVKDGSELRVSFDHAGQTNTIPLPATMIQDLSDLFGQTTNGYRLRLYSAWPFPNRKDRPVDDFMREALDHFATRTNGLYTKTVARGGEHSVRVAIPDLMVSASCVDCHNSRPDSPKRDWKLGEVRGVLEVEAALGPQLAANRAMIGWLAGLALTGAVLLIGLVAWGINRWVSRPILREMDGLQAVGAQVFAASSQVSSASQSLAEGASQQAASLEEAGASLEEMAGVTRNNAGNAANAKQLAHQTRAAAEAGVADVAEMSAAMDGIKTSGDNISKIIKTIDEIAFQTNILALNAAVEAARAGEAGMGFAVVAEEVRNLAQRSAQAAQETTAKIQDSIGKSGQGVKISSKVARSLQEIAHKAREMDALVAHIATASTEQSRGIDQLNSAVLQMNSVTQANAAHAEEGAAAAGQLNAQAAGLSETVAQLAGLVAGGGSAGADSRPERTTSPRAMGELAPRHSWSQPGAGDLDQGWNTSATHPAKADHSLAEV